MQPIPFIASSAEEAVAQIRERLGPEAVVLNVRPLPANGIARFWQEPMIEVLAHVPEAQPPEAAPIAATLAELRLQLDELKDQISGRTPGETESKGAARSTNPNLLAGGEREVIGGQWRVGGILQRTGLSSVNAQFVVDQLRSRHGEIPPQDLVGEIEMARNLLAGMWREPRPWTPHGRHVLIGPAGSGKTTCLCKWLTHAVLLEGRVARVWRLDGSTANMAEQLSVFCEILGLAGERMWKEDDAPPTEDIGFIDIPGVDWRDPLAIKELASQIKRLGMPHVHLVLNGAYDTAVLLAQARAFAALPIDDICVTHLDEEVQWGKLWNLALGTNYAIRHLSTGQNIPGDFQTASPEIIFAHQFPRKQGVL
jgi:flagellar biosynthesis protein FlhF